MTITVQVQYSMGYATTPSQYVTLTFDPVVLAVAFFDLIQRITRLAEEAKAREERQ